MSVVVKNDKKLEEYGKDMYNSNENYKNIVNFMEDSEFQKFFETNFNNLISTKTTLMFMKLYQHIGNIAKVSGAKLSEYEKLGVMDKLIKNTRSRQDLIKSMNYQWSSDYEFISNCLKDKE
jgi:hypothetical protein